MSPTYGRPEPQSGTHRLEVPVERARIRCHDHVVAASTDPPPPPCFQPILVVDDDADLRRLMARIFRAYAGHQVIEADSGHEALRLLYTTQPLPCLIVLDLMMRGLSGFDVIAELRRQPSLASVPVVVVSAAHDGRIIGKPFARLELMVCAQELCRASRVARAEASLASATATPLPTMRQSGTWRAGGSVHPPAMPRLRSTGR